MTDFSPENPQTLSWEHLLKLEKERRRRQKYIPHGGANRLTESRDEEVILFGRAGTGKTRAGLEKLYHAARNVKGFRGAIVRKTRASMTETVLETFENDVLGSDHPLIEEGPQRDYRRSYKFKDAQIIAAGIDKPARLLGSRFDLIFVSQAEELTQTDWELLMTRLRNHRMPYQQLLADCNPSHANHWIKRREKQKLVRLIEGYHEDNPRLWDAENERWTEDGKSYIQKLERLTGHRRLRLGLGKWASAEGVVYEGWNAGVHVIPRFDIPADWRRIRAIDFGFNSPFVCLWIAIDGDGRMYIYREIYMTRRLVQDHAKQIVDMSEGERIEKTLADHDKEDRETLHRYGVKTIAAKKTVTVGIEAVESRLKADADGKPRLFYLEDSLVEPDPYLMDDGESDTILPTHTAEEFDGYIWKPGGKDEPVKENDHGMDALRYATMYVDKQRKKKRVRGF